MGVSTKAVVAEAQEEGSWLPVQEGGEEAGDAGVIIVRSLPSRGLLPARCLVASPTWYRGISGMGTVAEHAEHQRQPGAQRRKSCWTVILSACTTSFNGTIVIDMRIGDAPHLSESLVCPDAAELAKLPLRDDALVIGDLPTSSLDVLRGRVKRCVYVLGAALAARLLEEFPFVGGLPADKRRVLPNIVAGRMVGKCNAERPTCAAPHVFPAGRRVRGDSACCTDAT